MKKTLATLLVVFVYCSLYSQDFNTMVGDWIRIDAEFVDGGTVPNNHHARLLIRYYFDKKELYVLPGNTFPTTYNRAGNVLKIVPGQTFDIEAYTATELTLVDKEEPRAIRYYLIPTEAFQRRGMVRYTYEVTANSDTVYASAPGIEPIYTKGQDGFMRDLILGFTQKASFDYSYVVLKDGTIGDVTIKASTNPKLDKRLIQLVKKSSGKWIPASYKGKPINVRRNDRIQLNSRT